MNRRKIRICGIILFTVAITLGIILTIGYFMHGKTTIVASSLDEATESVLRCASESIDYPIFVYDNSIKKDLIINVIFSDSKVRTVALSFTLYYDDPELISISEAQNHAAMNISFDKAGLGVDEFNAKYTQLDDSFRFNLFTNGGEVNAASARYFLIEKDNYAAPMTLDKYRKNYEQLGMICKII